MQTPFLMLKTGSTSTSVAFEMDVGGDIDTAKEWFEEIEQRVEEQSVWPGEEEQHEQR